MKILPKRNGFNLFIIYKPWYANLVCGDDDDGDYFFGSNKNVAVVDI